MPFRFLEPASSRIQTTRESYAREKELSEQVDQDLGFEIARVERELAAHPGAELWAHLSPDIFQTPYSELYRILAQLSPRPGDRVVDLGAGYGRMAFVLEAFFPGALFTGYELSHERVLEARRIFLRQGLEYSEMIEADLSDPRFHPVNAQFYFLYDFGTRQAIEKSLADLKNVARLQSIKVAARGRAARDAIERGHPWLSQVNPPRHFAHFSIYVSS